MEEKLNNFISELTKLRDKESEGSETYESLDACIDNLVDARYFLGSYYYEKNESKE